MICRMTKSTLEILANNIKRLMEYHDLAQDDIAKKTKIGQTTLSNVLRPGSLASITTKTLEELARFFDLEVYHLLIPDLPIEELLNKRIEKLVECYSQSTSDGRENIKRIAENEVRYSKIHTDHNSQQNQINGNTYG